MVKTKANQKINIDKLQITFDKLEQLKEKPKSELTLRESIYFLRDKLHSALKKGYSYEDLSEILEEQDILISASTLKQYLTEISKESASRKKRSKSVKSNKSNSSDKSDKTLSQAELDKGSLEDTTLSDKKLNEDNKEVQSDNGEGEVAINSKENSASNSEQLSAISREEGEANLGSSLGRKLTKSQTKVLSKNNRDLSEDFNQY